MRRLLRIPILSHLAAVRAMEHDVPNLAQSSAYSAIVALFPALIVFAAIVSSLPDSTPIRTQLGTFFERMLPEAVLPVLQSYFDAPHRSKPMHVLLISFLVSLSGASGVIGTYMEGFRRAHDLPMNCWTFWGRRARAYALVPLSLIPMALASSLIIFGNLITHWLANHVVPSIRTEVFVVAVILRWLIAFIGSTGLIALIYHMGTPVRQPWHQVFPGAIAATTMWFLTTLIFGWYVTRFANYSQVYGSLGAGIALLFWLFIVSVSILFGSEFNYVFHRHNPSAVSS